MITNFHNFRQNLHELLGQPPIDCHYYQKPSRPHFCRGCEPGHTFMCKQCGRLTSWCNGSDGDERERSLLVKEPAGRRCPDSLATVRKHQKPRIIIETES